MKFLLRSSTWYELDNVVDCYPCLDDFGLEIMCQKKERKIRISDENNRPIYQYDYYSEPEPYVTIDTVEQLMEFIRAVKKPVVIDIEDGRNIIEIYDGYRE